MNKKLQFIQKVLCLFLCAFIILTSLPIAEIVYAKDDIEFYPTSDEADDEIENMFSTTVKDLTSTVSVLQWLARQQTYSITKTVNSEVENIYINVPTLQMLLRNTFYKTMSDGWENDMYTPSSEFFPNIGLDKDGNLHTENVMTKFGFDLPTATYNGEYPKLFMSTSNIIPVKFRQKVWRLIKAAFGYSFINAPDYENYKSLYYYNHSYLNAEQEKLIRFVQDNWLTFEKEFIASDSSNTIYFSSPEAAQAEKVSLDEGKAAESFINSNKTKYDELIEKRYNRSWWEANCQSETTYREVDKEYKAAIESWYNDPVEVPEDWTTRDVFIPIPGRPTTGYDVRYYIDPDGNSHTALELKGEKPDWLEYREKNYPEEDYPPLTDEENEFIAEYEKQLMIYLRWKNFIEKMDNGTYGKLEPDLAWGSLTTILKNHPLLMAGRVLTGGNGVYYNHNISKYIYYSQCLLNVENDNDNPDTTGEDYCSKTYNGQKFYGDLFNFYIESGVYKLSYKNPSNSNNNSTSAVSYPFANKYPITSHFGHREAFMTNSGQMSSSNHRGIDIGAPMSTPILAAHSGTITMAGNNGGYGNMVEIKNGTLFTRYGHMSQINVKVGDSVQVGQTIGLVGSTGNSTGPHLHFEVWNGPPYNGGSELNPEKVMSGEVGVAITSPARKTKLTRTDALKIITTLQDKLGPAYPEVMSNWVTKMQMTADNRGMSMKIDTVVDPRVMPYDVDTLSMKSDKEQINIVDPRVEIYKNEDIIGSLIFRLDLPLLSIIFNKKDIADFLINTCAGNITKFSVFLMKMMNLEWFESHGLSPLDMWNSFSFNLIITILAILLVVQIVRYAIKFVNGRAGIIQVIGRFIIFTCLMGLVGLFMLPSSQQQTWDVIKKVFNISSSWIEEATWENSNNVAELLGDKKDNSVVYYIPYFNMWTSYMTGYNIESDAQTLDVDNKTPEVQKLKDDSGKILLPTINNQTTKVWAVVLADSFNTLGENHTIVDSTNLITYGKKQIYVNGERVNNNAYRVVDHFIAPRINATIDKDVAKLDNSINENYNGKFQKLDLLGLVGKLIGIINIAFIALIKFLTFIWFWYQLYVFIFQILLGVIENKGNIKSVIISTFIPLLQLPLLGLWATVLMKVSIWADGFMSLIVNIALLYVSYLIIQKWATSRYFPATLKPVAMFTRYKYQIQNLKERYADSMLGGMQDEFPELYDEDGNLMYDEIFLPDGTRKYKGNEYDKIYYYATRQMYHSYRRGGEENIKNNFGEAARNYVARQGYLGDSNDKNDLSFNNSKFAKKYKETYDDNRQQFHEAYDEENSNLGETQSVKDE